MERRDEKKSKRPISEEESEEDRHCESKRTRPSSLLHGSEAHVFPPQQLATLKNLIHPVVQEMVETQVDYYIRSILSRNSKLSNDLIEKVAVAGSGTLKFKLFFFYQVDSTIFTNNEIRATNGKSLVVAICDTTKSNAVIEDGPLSSALVEIVVLDGDFGSAQREEETSWSASDFNNNIVSQREGKRPLVVGTLVFYLENGVGFIKGLSFTDNSSWMKSKKFRFGVRIVDEKILAGFPRIGEGISKPFRVMDHRGEVNKKHHPPKREDKIWRLEGIGKDGAYDNRLSAQNIKTVDDFLKIYHEKGDAYLKKILGKVPQIIWEKMVSNALECDVPIDPFGVHELVGGEAFNQNLEVGEPNNFGDNNGLQEPIEGHNFNGELLLDLASFNPTSAVSLSHQNLMAQNLEVGDQKSFNDGHGLSGTLVAAHEFGVQLQEPASYTPSFQPILAENYEAMGLGRGFEGLEEQHCNNMFHDHSMPLLVPHGEASIPYNPTHEVENATTPNQYYPKRPWTA